MDRKNLIKLVSFIWLILMWGGITAVFAGIFLSWTLAIGGMVSVFVSLWFAYWKIKIEAKEGSEYYERFADVSEKIKADLQSFHEANCL